jgi:hypothetical protein
VIITPVQYTDVPIVNDIAITIPASAPSMRPRNAIFNYFTLIGTVPAPVQITLSVTPYNPFWVEVWLDSTRLLNTNPQSPEFTISENVMTFNSITTGNLVIVIDTEPLPYYAANIIHSTQIQRDAYGAISLRSEPVALTQPWHGYVRLSGDRKYLVYVPDIGFTGIDTFSWTLMTQNGQVGAAKCTRITVV